MSRNDLAVEQILAAMRKQQEAFVSLQDALIMRARLQEYAEAQFNMLASLAGEGIEFVNAVHEGDRATAEWIKRRDELVERAKKLAQGEF